MELREMVSTLQRHLPELQNNTRGDESFVQAFANAIYQVFEIKEA